MIKHLSKRSNTESDTNLSLFSTDYNSSPIIIVESLNNRNNIDKLHPLNTGKLFHNKFNGTVQINPIGSKVKLLFDSVNKELNLKRTIPFT